MLNFVKGGGKRMFDVDFFINLATEVFIVTIARILLGFIAYRILARAEIV